MYRDFVELSKIKYYNLQLARFNKQTKSIVDWKYLSEYRMPRNYVTFTVNTSDLINSASSFAENEMMWLVLCYAGTRNAFWILKNADNVRRILEAWEIAKFLYAGWKWISPWTEQKEEDNVLVIGRCLNDFHWAWTKSTKVGRPLNRS